MPAGRHERGRRWSAVSVAATAAVLSGAFAALSGCGGCRSQPDYPPNLTFPPRTDRLVLKSPEQTPAKLNEPGKIEQDLAALDALGGKTVDPASVPADARAALDSFLKDSFGTPAAPTVALAGEAEVGATAERLKLSNAHLSEGSKLFRRHCLQCHNLVGDGRGTSGATVPFPRDYRRGAFKFVSSGEGGKPRRADLLRTLAEGLKGTPMPSFSLLPEGERDLLAGYVTYLAVRGQVEFESLAALASGQPNDPGARLKAILAEWEKAENAPPLPAQPDDGEPGSPTYLAAVARGHALFTQKTDPGAKDNSCISCHGEYGRKPQLRYDLWGTVARPADFTQPGLKGGTRPEDVFARVRFGIAPVGMPAHPKLTDRQVWDLVRFVRSAPYMRELPPDVRAAVYPTP